MSRHEAYMKLMEESEQAGKRAWGNVDMVNTTIRQALSVYMLFLLPLTKGLSIICKEIL